VSHHSWDLVVPRLAESFRVLAYDRRGHSETQRVKGQDSVREDVADLAALIDYLGFAPTWIAGNSFGASITLRLAGERLELFRGLSGHEPPLLSLLADELSLAPMLEEVRDRIGTVIERIASDDHAGAAKQFVEKVGARSRHLGTAPARSSAKLYRECADVLGRGSRSGSVCFRPHTARRLPSCNTPIVHLPPGLSSAHNETGWRMALAKLAALIEAG
jgi:pimeloyl-ACP methyl ester carboxylesterase